YDMSPLRRIALSRSALSRRRFLTVGAALGAAGVLAACRSPAGPTSGPTPSGSATGTGSTSEPSPSTSSPPPPLAWGPTADDVAAAIADAAELSPEQVAGHVIVPRYQGTDPQIAAGIVTDLQTCGIILFAENISSLDQVVATAAAVQQAQRD